MTKLIKGQNSLKEVGSDGSNIARVSYGTAQRMITDLLCTELHQCKMRTSSRVRINEV